MGAVAWRKESGVSSGCSDWGLGLEMSRMAR